MGQGLNKLKFSNGVVLIWELMKKQHLQINKTGLLLFLVNLDLELDYS